MPALHAVYVTQLKHGAMILKILNNSTVDDLQDKFNECFPGHWIAFYDGQHALKNNDPADRFTPITDISFNHQTGELKIYSASEAGKVLVELKKRFGLLARIFHIRNKRLVPLQEDESLANKPLHTAH